MGIEKNMYVCVCVYAGKVHTLTLTLTQKGI